MHSVRPNASAPPPTDAPVRTLGTLALLALIACLVAVLVAPVSGATLAPPVLWPAGAFVAALLRARASAPGAAEGSLARACLVGIPAALVAGHVWTGSTSFALAAALASVAGPAAARTVAASLAPPGGTGLLAMTTRELALVLGVASPVTALLMLAGGLAAGSVGSITAVATTAFGWWAADASARLLLDPALQTWIDRGAPYPSDGGTGDRRADGSRRPPPVAAVIVGLFAAALLVAVGVEGEPPTSAGLLLALLAGWTALGTSPDGWRRPALSGDGGYAMATALVPPGLAAGWSLGDPEHAGAAATALVIAAGLGTLLRAAVEDRAGALRRLARQPLADEFTGLGNARGLEVALARWLAARSASPLGLLAIEVTNLAAIRDLCGDTHAQAVERGIANAMRRVTRTSEDHAARTAPGRFALLTGCASIADVRRLARELHAALHAQPVPGGELDARPALRVGGLLVDSACGATTAECLAALDDALSIAAGARDLPIYVESLGTTMLTTRRTHRRMLERVADAIRAGRIELFAQPIADPDSGADRTISYEILTRLRDEDGSLVQPSIFLQLAEESGMTAALDRAVIAAVFRYLSARPDALARTHRCAINLSAMSVADAGLPAWIVAEHASAAVPAERFVFEIRERDAALDPGGAARLIESLRAEGFGIAIDDFGEGFASFELLRRHAPDYVKIDGSHVRNLRANPIDEEAVRATVRIAARLSARTIAEHVHDDSLRERLPELGIERMQGRAVGPPRPLSSIFAPTAAERVG